MEEQLLQQLCDEYALGLLDGDDREQIRRLAVAGSPEVRRGLRDSEELLAQLAWTATLVEPPALVRSQLLNRINADVRRTQAPPTPARRGGWALGWAVAAALAVASLYGYMALRGAHSELRRLEQQLASVQGEAVRSRKILEVVLARDARFIRLSTSPNEPVFRAFWGGAAGLVLSGLDVPAPKAGRTFQLWVVPKGGGTPVSAGVFAPQANGQVLLVAETQVRPGDAAALAISDEPAGGSAQPTTKPVFVGPVGD
jgi:anti-sigma-K factor RskA